MSAPWWQRVWSWLATPSGFGGPGGDTLATLEADALEEHAQSMRWFVEVLDLRKGQEMRMKCDDIVGWTVDRVEVEAAGASPMPDGMIMCWMLVRLHISRRVKP